VRVSIFKKILSFGSGSEDPAEKRKATRYPVGAAFPLKTALNLFGRDSQGKLITSPDGTGRDWSGKMINLSAAGASMRLPASAEAARGEFCRLKFIIGDSALEIPANVAHFRVHTSHATCGVVLDLSDEEIRLAYRQLLQPVMIGSSLAPVDPKQVTQDAEGVLKEEFDGDTSKLTVWREGPEGKLIGFDFLMSGYGVRWSEGMPELDSYGTIEGSDAIKEISEVEQVEVRWLFCLAVPNLPKAVPADVREFLGKLVA
jgi:hypothetical protein